LIHLRTVDGVDINTILYPNRLTGGILTLGTHATRANYSTYRSADNSKTRSSFLFQEFGGETSQFFKKKEVILQQM
jgi:hypothetical protein